MSIISSSYFIGDNNIPNTSYDDVKSIVDNLIAVYEDKYLERMIGYELLVKVKEANSDVPPLEPEQKFKDLLNGVEFIGLDGIKKKWLGFKNTETFESPIADFVFWFYLKRNATQTTGVGEATASMQNAMNASSKQKMVDAHNRMVDKNKILHELLTVKYLDYPEYQYRPSGIENRSMLVKLNPYGI